MNGEHLNVIKANIGSLVENGRATRFGVDWPGLRCHARTRKGTPCLKPALKGKNRCQLHGGLSTGPRTEAGLENIRAANTKHGQRSKAHIERVREIRYELKLLEEIARYHGWIR